MKFKVLATSFFAAAGLAACDNLPTATAARAETAPVAAPVYDVKCTDEQGRVLAEGQSIEGLVNWGGGQTRITFTDGREYQQAGGVCTGIKPAPQR